MAGTVTATQGGASATSNGMGLRVMVITGALAVASQTGGSAGTNVASGTTYTLSITTTQANSRVYGAGTVFTGGVSSAAAAATTLIDNFLDATNADNYVTWKATSLTGTPGATTLGYTNTANTGGTGPCAYEVMVSATLAEDGSGPAFASTTTATAVTTASFTPPGGSLLVAMVAANVGTGSETMTLSDTLGTLNWTEKARNTAGAGNDYAGVWIADVPGGATSGPALFPGMASRPSAILRAAGRRGATHSR